MGFTLGATEAVVPLDRENSRRVDQARKVQTITRRQTGLPEVHIKLLCVRKWHIELTSGACSPPILYSRNGILNKIRPTNSIHYTYFKVVKQSFSLKIISRRKMFENMNMNFISLKNEILKELQTITKNSNSNLI